MPYSSVNAWDRLADWALANRKAGRTDNDLIQTPAILDIISPAKGQRVLDAGCGHGVLSVALAKRGALVTGIDPSARMIGLARQEASKAGVQIDFHCTMFSSFGQDDGRQFDVILAANVLHYLDDPSELMALATGNLAVHGRFILADAHPVTDAGGTPGELLERKVSNYFDRTTQNHVFRASSGEKVEVKYYRRTLADIFSLVTDAGFAITGFREPQPCAKLVHERNRKYYEAGNRFPVYFVLEAKRFKDGDDNRGGVTL